MDTKTVPCAIFGNLWKFVETPLVIFGNVAKSLTKLENRLNIVENPGNIETKVLRFNLGKLPGIRLMSR